MSSRGCLLLTICLMFAPSLVSAQDDLQISEVNSLSLSSGASARIFPSPDAKLVAYDSAVRLNSHVDRYLTISTVEPGDEPAYYERPEELPRGFDSDPSAPYVPFAWSPDSARLAIASQPLVSLTDTDLWIFDLASESWTNLAEDNYSGPLTAEGGGTPPAGTIIDQQPAWSPDGTTIAVERTLVTDGGAFGDPQITLVNAETGEARDLTAVPGASSSGAVTSTDWSSDGDTLALTLLHRQPDADNDGLWLVDAASGEATQALTLAQIEDAVHSVIPELAMTSVGPVFWSPDSTRLPKYGPLSSPSSPAILCRLPFLPTRVIARRRAACARCKPRGRPTAPACSSLPSACIPMKTTPRLTRRIPACAAGCGTPI